MGETGSALGSMQRLNRIGKNLKKDGMKVAHSDDDFELVEMEEEEEDWEPGAGRKTIERVVVVERSPKRGHKGKMSSKQTTELMGFDAVMDAVSHDLGSLKLSNARARNSRAAGIVVNAVSQASVAMDRSQEGIMERSFAHTGLRGQEAPGSSSSNDEGEGGDSTDGESAGEQEEISTSLNQEASALLAELMQVIQKGGDLKKLRVDHLKAYLRHHGLRVSGLKNVLLNRIEEHLIIKDGQGQVIYPRSSFTINCRGDVCLGDTVLFSQNVYDSYDIVKRAASGPPLGKRWVAGRVVNESYGAEKQQHTFTIEVFWSTGTNPFYVMRPLQIKGRNLYRMHTSRQPWNDEAERERVLAEKHARGEEAREKRRVATSSRGSSRTRPSSRGHSKTRHQGDSSRSKIPPAAIPPLQSSMQHERIHGIHREHAASFSRTRQSDWAPTRTLNSMQQGITHMACSARGCEKAGAKHCVTRSCASCCLKSSSTRGSCPRHYQ